MQITTSDGEARKIGAGEVILVEDTRGKGHLSPLVTRRGRFGSISSPARSRPSVAWPENLLRPLLLRRGHQPPDQQLTDDLSSLARVSLEQARQLDVA